MGPRWMRVWWICLAAAVLVGGALLLARPARAGSGARRVAKLQMKGWLAGPGGQAPARLKNAYWINLIMGRARGSAVPKNEILVGEHGCGNSPYLALDVWDKDTGSLAIGSAPIVFDIGMAAPSDTKQIDGTYKRWDFAFSATDVGALTTRIHGVMRYDLALVKGSGEVCPKKGRTRALWVTIENGDREVYGKGKLLLGKAVDGP